MTTPCPKGHSSEWPDWCSVCGERLGEPKIEAGQTAPDQPVASSAASVAVGAGSQPTASGADVGTGPTCENCGEPRHELDVFCESCGYDFASGSLPEQATADQAADASAAASAPMHVKVSFDAEFFAASVGDAELELPDPLPSAEQIPLPGTRTLIGRTSTSRGVFPEIDLRAIMEDPAVSSRHAMIERDPAGNWTLTDLGSTNGTFLTPAADEPITPGVAMALTPDTAIYLGAWTRIDFTETGS